MTKNAKCTVAQFFNWYTGGQSWERGSQITDSMSINGEHAQDQSRGGEEAYQFLVENENEIIEIENIETSSVWDIEFELKGKRFRIQASEEYK